MADNAECFPRGSRKAQPGDESKPRQTAKRDRTAFTETAVQSSVPKFVELLKYKTLSVGMKLWGVVHDISHQDLTISLPHGLRGFVKSAETSDVLAELAEVEGNRSDSDSDAEETTQSKSKSKAKLPSLLEIFSKGQLVQCVVTGLGTEKGTRKGKGSSKRIDLSLCLSKTQSSLDSSALKTGSVLSACVRSVEDHGYILSFGVAGVSGFLLNADAKAALDRHGKPFLPGSILTCAVLKLDKKKKVASVITTSKAPDMQDVTGITLNELTPGMLVSAKVTAVLADGLMMNFLTYFTGMVDWFHLAEELPTKDWKELYSENKRFPARILYVDPVNKRVGLTLKPSVVAGGPVPRALPTGMIIDTATIYRIDPGMGMLLKTPAEKGYLQTSYMHISDAADEHVEKLEKVFKPGQKVQGRIIGCRLLDGLGSISLKRSVVEQEIFSYDDAKPGRIVHGTVASVETFGLLVKLSDTMKALCPLAHLSDAPRSKVSSKFTVGMRLKFRIMETDESRRRITLTHKKTLMSSKLPLVDSLEAAKPGVVSHGYVTGIESFGVFVSFYNSLKGIARVADLGLAPDQTPADAFQMNQVVKCKVLGADSNRSDRLRLSLDLERLGASSGAEDAEDSGQNLLALGDVLTGTVFGDPNSGPSTAIEVAMTSPKHPGVVVKGLMEVAHLSDHPIAAEAIRGSLQSGADLGKLVVLERREGKVCPYWVSRKASLVGAAETMPQALDQLHVGASHPGYVASISDAGCFVRFLGRLTGLVPVPQLADTFVTDPRQHCAVGQSVQAHVLDVDQARGRSVLCLKPSVCAGASPGVELLRALFADTDLAHTLTSASETNAGPDWSTDCAVGSVVSGAVYEVKEYGVLLNLPGVHSDVVGFAALHQLGGAEGGKGPETGREVKARVLDVSKRDGIVDLTLKEELLTAADAGEKKSKKKKKAHDVKMDEEVDVEVQLVKEDYLVVTLLSGKMVGFIGTKDFNNRTVDVHSQWQPGARLKAQVKALPDASTGDRLLLSVKESGSRKRKSASDLSGDQSPGKKRTRPTVEEIVGTIVTGTVTAVKQLHVDVKCENRWRGRLHVTEAGLTSEKEMSGGLHGKFKVDQTLEAEVLGIAKGHTGEDSGALELSLRISGAQSASPPRPRLETLEAGAPVGPGWVSQVGADWLWVSLSPTLRGRLFILEGSSDPEECRKWTSRFAVGQPLGNCRVVSRDLARRTLDLTLRSKADSVKVGAVLPGRVAKILPNSAGMNVQLGSHTFGRVHVCDLGDQWSDQPCRAFKEGQFLSCAVVAKDGAGRRIDLSLRASQGGGDGKSTVVAAKKTKKDKVEDADTVPEIKSASALSSGQLVSGYVKSTSGKGCFIALSRTVDALVRLGNLSETFVTNPAAEFPPGKLVQGRVVSADATSGRVELTLKLNQVLTGGKGTSAHEKREEDRKAAIAKMDVGEIVWGKVRKIENFGVFVDMDGEAGVAGMCHVSELADEFVRKPETLFNVGDRVRAKIIRVDEEKGKLYLGLKPSYFSDEDPMEPPEAEKDGEAMEEDENVSEEEDEQDNDSAMEDEDDDESDQDEDDEDVEDEDVAPPTKSKKPAAPVLQVDEDMDLDDESAPSTAVGSDAAFANPTDKEASVDGASKRKRDKKREREAREAAVAAEERKRMGGEAAPQSEADFERMLLTAQSSSYIWIKFIAWHISRSDVAAARKVAERALESIHYREEGERFNVWMAYLNLENLYGEPTPAEAVASLFQRAVNAADGKKLHLSTVAMYERSEKPELAEQLLKAACRKYSMSAKVWLRHIEFLLARGKGDNAKALMDRSLQSLPRRKHIKVISRTALLEFKIGDAERGRSIFEGVLNNFPKRVDLWSMYLDQEVKLGVAERTRGLFERVTCLSLPAKKMKTLFKKYLEFEKDHGDEEHVEHVKTKALEFAEQHL